MSRSLFTAFLLLVICARCFAQTSFQGIEPGRSTRGDVEKTLGQHLQAVSETLSQYKSVKEDQKIFVQYRRNVGIVERIELAYSKPLERSSLIKSLDLPTSATASKTNTKGRLEEYFSSKYIVLTHATEEASGVIRVGYYSRELFDSAIAKLGSSTNAGPDALGPDQVGWSFNNETATILTFYGSTSAASCRSDCEKNPKCKAYSWIKPGGILPADPPMCYLMSAWIKLFQHPCCISAVRSMKKDDAAPKE